MTEKLLADASPEKQLFISLITRDIPLIAAFLDLIDNSINSAVEPFSKKLLTAQDYYRVSQDDKITPVVDISLDINADRVEINDTATGISAQTAKDHVFKFGRASGEKHDADRLSVYGIGLKRAIFKLGNKITISSDHIEGGFDLKLDVKEWAKDTTLPWQFEITARAPVKAGETGTKILVEELYDDCKRRLSDGVFVAQLKDAISKTYAFYLSKFVNISVENEKIESINIGIGTNITVESFTDGTVSCAITAGIGIPQGGRYTDKLSGWFVFCNGRTVISADKSTLTGWGELGLLPIFQPKHRPFFGTVFFVSQDAELLPWSTTKSGINVDSNIWQEAKRHMTTVGRTVISFLDGRYTDAGTEVQPSELKAAAGDSINVMTASVAKPQTFSPPKEAPPAEVSIQYRAKVSDVKRIKKYLGRSSMSAGDVGLHTFNHFLRNEIEEE